MASVVQQNILRLQIAINHIQRVQVTQRQRNLRHKYLGLLLGEAPFLLQMEKELTATIIIQHKIEFRFGLKCVSQMHQKRMLQRLQDFALGIRVLHLMLGNQRLLFQNLHGKYFAIVLLAHLHHFAKRAASNHLQKLKIVGLHLLLAVDELASHFGRRRIIHLVVVVVLADQLLIASQSLLARLQSRHVLRHRHRQHRVGLDLVDRQLLALFALVQLSQHRRNAILVRRFVAIVVLLRNMNGKLQRGARDRDRHNLLQINATLAFTNLFGFQIVQRLVGQQQDTILLLAAFVDLGALDRQHHTLLLWEIVTHFR
mmetsp:Transcript_15773/g.24208  ORF Transcript_15773/g.24208 Transcript_15773/m.24208 type:complete len:314 (-) Transcript_15773:157-1098(-)